MFLFQYWVIRVEQIDNYIEFVFTFHSPYKLVGVGDGDGAEGKTVDS